MEGSLLAHIAGNFISQYENVANSSVAYLLNRYPAPRVALKKILSLDKVPANYMTELSTRACGRPDITGLDANGKKVIIIEGKFWANLTDNQPDNYLEDLADGGLLLFLAPDRRITSLQNEIRKRLGREDDRLVIFSWMTFLDLIESENSKEHNSDLASDLVQLRALCSKMDEEGMPPLSMTDLDPMNGRISYQLAELINICNSQIRSWDESDFSGLKSSGGQSGYGFYFRAFGFGCWLGFSSYDWFMRKSHTPIWLHIQSEQFKVVEKIYYNLNDFDPENAYYERDKALYAIVLQPGMDRNQVVDLIVGKVRSVLSSLQRSTEQPDRGNVAE